MSDEANPKETKQKRTRSPAYPAIDLQTALARAGALWTKINRHAAPLDSIASYWGYEPKSSKAMSEAAAMIKYGILSDDGIGSNRTIKLTEDGIKLSYNPDKDSPDYLQGLKKAALMPSIHQELWERYHGNFPDDAVIKRYLVVDRKFNEQYVEDFISQFRRTIEFAKLSDADTMQEAGEEIEPTPEPMTETKQESKPHIIIPTRRPQFYGGGAATPIAPSPDELSLPLDNGKSVRIPKMSEDNYNLFLETLKLWKKKLILSDSKPLFPEPPFVVKIHNGSFEMMVNMVGAKMVNGEKIYQDDKGNDHPASRVFPNLHAEQS